MLKVFLLLFAYAVLHVHTKFTECELKDFLQNTYEKEAREMCYKANIAEFDYETHISNKTMEEKVSNITLEIAAWEKITWTKYFQDVKINDYKDPTLKRHIRTLLLLGNAALCEEKLKQLTNTTNKMVEIYGTAKLCPYTNQDCNVTTQGLSLEPSIEDIMKTSTDYDELVYVWKKWRDATGAKIKDLYETYVTLSNEAAVANKFKDKGAYWRDDYEDPNFVQNMDDLWTQVEPLYTELHRFVGRKLKHRYGDKLNISDGLIPAHVFGNMWAQSWNKIADLIRPFPKVNKVDIDLALKEEGYTVLRIFQTADKFYQSLGLLPMDMAYNECSGSMITQPEGGDRNVLCHASAWDFCDGHTYRLKMCTQVSFEHFITVHHEMGHIQYYMQYKDLPYNFREGANPGFHEAIGDTIALSVTMPTHLLKLNLLKNYTRSGRESINALMAIALDKIAFLPFGLIIDKWRWDVFSGAVPKSKWNSHWWKYRMKYQKIKPPVERSDETDFDPGAKYHVPGDSQYIAYFLAHILQFQFFKSLCITANQYNPNKIVPLYLCDFYQSTAAGDKLRAGLKLGSSKHWSEVLEILTGSKKVSAEPLLEYFEPLYKYMKCQNKKYDNCLKKMNQTLKVNICIYLLGE